jgi:hypothetical protein
LVLFSCGYYSYAPVSARTSLILRDGIPNDREIEFESSVGLQLSLEGNSSPHADVQVAQRQGAKATLKPVPSNVLSMFERAVEEQVSCFSLFASLLRYLIPVAEARFGRSAD